MDLGGFLWFVIKFVGPIVLLAVIAWAVLHNRASRRQRAETERATARLYEEEERASDPEDDKAP